MDPNYSVHHVRSSESPLITKEFLDEQRRNMTPETYKMEYEAEFTEAAMSFFPQDLIRSCVDTEIEFISSIEDHVPSGQYFGGCDLGKLADYSVFTVVSKEGETLKLVFLRQFPLETPYSSVIGFIVKAQQKFHFIKILIDKSGVGEAVTEEIKAQGLANAEGQSFTTQSKAEMLGYLKVKMQQGLFKMPYDRRLCEQINEQRFEYTKSGQLKFWHPTGSHDDQLWSLAMTVWATKGERPSTLRRVY
ncbi:MAG: Terminase-like family protein [Candidatus Bathyarchaeota archaeon BA2]|nr:MAG: Terminase-like family protein [Candidatus Bathyarchaeota archaeon BA2]